MSESEHTSIEQIAEYETQLAGIVELLEASPDDESLLALKKDIEELLELSRANLVDNAGTLPGSVKWDRREQSEEATNTTSEDLSLRLASLPSHPPEMDTGISTTSKDLQLPHASLPPPPSFPEKEHGIGEASAVSITKKEKAHKVKKSGRSKYQKEVKDFVLPDHLQPNDEDTDAERNKKRRAAKALKNKWRLQKREIESRNRQKSWQSFQKKSFSSSSGSIFATKEGLNDRVGVVSKKQLTEFGERKRHK